jgi:hypothetical protein
MSKTAVIFLIVSFLAVSFSCSKIEVKKPAGFAELRKGSSYYAISPEGVLFRVRHVENYPEKNLDFWSKAVKKHLTEEGYQFIDQEGFSATKNPGVLFQWGAPYGRENYIYLTAIIVLGKDIAVAEVACEYSLFATYRDSLLASLKSVSLN